MASAHKTIKAMPKMVMQEDVIYRERKQDCKLPTEQKCADAVKEYDDYDFTDTTNLTHVLDKLCDQDCRDPLNAYYECSKKGKKNYADFLCVMQNNKYCFFTTTDYNVSCGPPCTCNSQECREECASPECRSCLDRYFDDFSCCLAEYKRQFPTYAANFNDSDFCNNAYTACSTSGSAIAVPTVLTALLLIVMAAIVM